MESCCGDSQRYLKQYRLCVPWQYQLFSIYSGAVRTPTAIFLFLIPTSSETDLTVCTKLFKVFLNMQRSNNALTFDLWFIQRDLFSVLFSRTFHKGDIITCLWLFYDNQSQEKHLYFLGSKKRRLSKQASSYLYNPVSCCIKQEKKTIIIRFGRIL